MKKVIVTVALMFLLLTLSKFCRKPAFVFDFDHFLLLEKTFAQSSKNKTRATKPNNYYTNLLRNFSSNDFFPAK